MYLALETIEMQKYLIRKELDHISSRILSTAPRAKNEVVTSKVTSEGLNLQTIYQQTGILNSK